MSTTAMKDKSMFIIWKIVSLMVLFVLASFSAGGHECDRSCIRGSVSMTCYYNWTVEKFIILSKDCRKCPLNITDCDRVGCIPGNGQRRVITVINRQMPGPSITVCKDDKIIVDVHNHAGTDATSIHWHGIHQMRTPFMDGVPFVTQCPIIPFSTFQYSYTTAEVGTYFYHSHMGFQKADGMHGMLVVRQPLEDDPNKDYFDHDLTEHQIMIADWMNRTGEEMFTNIYHLDEDYGPFLTSILVNGRGRLEHFHDSSAGTKSFTPYSTFVVKKGKRYRFRVCASTNWICPVEMSVDGHNLSVITTDGNAVEPVTVQALVLNPGERFDVVIDANQELGTYWMVFAGLLRCKDGGAVGRAILKYEGAPDVEPREILRLNSSFTVLNPVNDLFDNQSQIGISALQSLTPLENSLKMTPDKQFFIPFDLYPNINPIYKGINYHLPMVNSTAFLYPTSPMLSQFNDINKDILCTDKGTGKNCSIEFCQCTYFLKISLGDVVELILIDVGPTSLKGVSHPWHLHGSDFRVLGASLMDSDNTVEAVKALDAAGKIRRNFDRPVLKDTVMVPHGGYTVIRFLANNPGFWALHCHVDMHMDTGMILVLQVGELKDIPKMPDDFPKCANFPMSTS